MKKNITINLFGALYAIDEDAYELLRKYEENMRAYFSRKEGGAEIADDIENRVAELFAELKAAGVEAVTIEHVEEIIRRVGNPEEMDDDMADAGDGAGGADVPEGGGAPANDVWERLRRWWNGRKLYRDSEDVMVGGVMSGLCRCFGGTDPLPWRIGMVLLTICSFYTFAIIYLVLWAIVPQARTAEDKLRMQGRPVNPGTLNEELMRNVNRAGSSAAGSQVVQNARGCLGTLLALVLFCGRLLVFVMLGTLFFLLLGCMAVVFYAALHGAGALISCALFDADMIAAFQAVPGVGWKLWTLGLSGLVVLGLPMGALLHRLLHHPVPQAASPARRFTLIAVWICALAVAFVMSVVLALGVKSAEQDIDRRQNTVNGIYLPRYTWNTLQENGWQLLRFDNCNDKGCGFYDSVEPIPGEWWRYMNIWKGEGDVPMCFQVERDVDVPAGRYCVEALACANGNGCCLYLKPAEGGKEKLCLGEVPANTGMEGNIARMTWAESRSVACFSAVADSAAWDEVRQRADKWNYVCSDTLRHTGGALKYGISNDVNFTSRGWNGTHFSVSAVQLRRVGDL